MWVKSLSLRNLTNDDALRFLKYHQERLRTDYGTKYQSAPSSSTCSTYQNATMEDEDDGSNGFNLGDHSYLPTPESVSPDPNPLKCKPDSYLPLLHHSSSNTVSSHIGSHASTSTFKSTGFS
ncbi:hypothetical protein K439DRAFT_1628700 [Ramaria rubella]|nr:hypothetical protein K439DRAFT_1628700 [Ramaria rubella]